MARNRKGWLLRWGSGLLLLGLALPSALGGENRIEATAGYTAIGQVADDDALDEQASGSLDLFFGWLRGRGRLDLYVEGNTSLDERAVATLLPDSNADAGTALDPDRSGRVQLSELKYSLTDRANRTFVFGLLDPSTYLDATRVNNDENMQFLGASFVNNPTIEFSDYALGFVSRIPAAGDGPRWNLVLTSSHGISDNPNLSYSQLLNVVEDDKGLFAGGEAAWLSTRHLIRAGAWLSTAAHESLDGADDDAVGYGAYSAIGASQGRLSANLRLGLANPDVSLASGFASLGLQWDRDARVLGLAIAHTWLSPDARTDDSGDHIHVEGYVRWRLARELYLTPSLQYLRNGGFDPSGGVVDDGVTVLSLRLHQVFDLNARERDRKSSP